MFHIRSAIQYSLLVFVFGVSCITAAAQYDATPLISWHPEGAMLAVTNVEGVTILDGDTRETLNEIAAKGSGIPRVTAEWSPDGSKIAIFNNGNIEIWESPWSPPEAAHVATILTDYNGLTNFAWNPSSTQLAVGIGESVKLADAQTGLLLQSFTGSWNHVTQVLWTSDDRLVQTGFGRFTAIFDKNTGEIMRSFYTTYTGVVANRSIALSPDNNRIAIGDEEGLIEIRNDTRTPGNAVQIDDADQWFWIPSQGETGGEFSVEQPSKVLDLDWSFDGRYLASASDDGTVRVWNPDTGENLTTIKVAPGAWVGSAAWRPNSLELAYGNLDGTVTILVPDNIVPAPASLSTPNAPED